MTLLVGKDLCPKLSKLVKLDDWNGVSLEQAKLDWKPAAKRWWSTGWWSSFFSNWGREIPIPFYAALLWDMKGCWVLKGNGILIILAGLLSHLQSNRVFPKRNQNWIPIGTMKLIKIKFVQSENWFLHFILSDPGQRNLSRQDPISWEIRNPLSTFFPGCYVPAHPNQQHQLLSFAPRWEQMLNIYSLFLPSHSNQNTAKPLKQGHLRWI